MSRPFKVYYRKNPTFMLDKKLTKAQVLNGETHAFVLAINADDVESVFYRMQGENWSPNGEGRVIIMAQGLQHTSMSVGDVAVDVQGDVMWQADMAGWKEVRK